MSDLMSLLQNTKDKRWCTNIPCTTCGASEFRYGLEQIGGTRVIAELGELDSDMFYAYVSQISSVLRWLRYEWILSEPSDLELISGSPAYNYFHRQYREHRELAERSNENRLREEARQAEFKNARALKASHDLLKALVRGDFRAVQGLLAKGANPDFNNDRRINTARQTARLLGREQWLSSVVHSNQKNDAT